MEGSAPNLGSRVNWGTDGSPLVSIFHADASYNTINCDVCAVFLAPFDVHRVNIRNSLVDVRLSPPHLGMDVERILMAILSASFGEIEPNIVICVTCR